MKHNAVQNNQRRERSKNVIMVTVMKTGKGKSTKKIIDLMASLLPTRFFWLQLRFGRFRRLRLWFCRRCRRLWLRFSSRFLRFWLIHGVRIVFWFLRKFFVGHGRSRSNRILLFLDSAERMYLVVQIPLPLSTHWRWDEVFDYIRLDSS